MISNSSSSYLQRFADVHQDDIHAVIDNNNDTIISGSKDCTVKIWSKLTFECLETFNLGTFNCNNINYEKWITAMHPLGNGEWAYADRAGELVQYNAENHEVGRAQVQVSSHISKQRNANRINCLSRVINSESKQMFVGVAKSIQIWNRDSLKFKYKVNVSENDWIYCIEPYCNNQYLVVVGSNLELWNNAYDNYKNRWTLRKKSALHEEIKSEIFFDTNNVKRRPFISALEYLKDQTLLGMVDFSSRIKLLDFQTKRLISNQKAHEGRIWSIKKYRDNCYATSADDQLVKLWDLRQKGPIHVYGPHSGRVSNLLTIDENTLLASSCPDKVFESAEKASFTLWDVRK